MTDLLKKVLKDWFTENDGVSFCPASTLLILGGLAMIGEFLYKGSTDFQGFAIGMTCLAGGKALNKYVEGKNAGTT